MRALPASTPVILFARGVHENWDSLAETGAKALGIDWNLDLAAIASKLPAKIAVQGNLDPALLLADPAEAARQTRRLLDRMQGRNGFIFNLGHGVPPNASIEAISAIASTVQESAS